MKVMQVNCTNGGSVGKIMRSISDALLAEDHDCSICYSLDSYDDKRKNEYKMSGKYEPGITHRISCLSGYSYGFAYFATKRLKRMIVREKPDIVHLHCPNNNMNVYRILAFLKKRNIPIVLTNHCEMFYTGNCSHSYSCNKWQSGCGNCEQLKNNRNFYFHDRTAKAWQKMKRAFEGHEKLIAVSVSKWVYDRSRSSPILGNYPNCVIENGINTEIYHQFEGDRVSVKKKYGISFDKKIVLFVTAKFNTNVDDIKGGYYFVKLAEKILERNPNIEFLLVGSRKIEVELPENIKAIGRVENEPALAELYGISDLTIVVSKKETYSMPCAESLCCGTPVVGFKAGGPEAISLPEYSEFCEYGDLDTLTDIVIKFVNSLIKGEERKISLKAKQRYDCALMNRRYIELYKGLIER